MTACTTTRPLHLFDFRSAGVPPACSLLQVPESFGNRAPNRDWLTTVGAELRPHRVAVEFRHRSWAAANLTEWLEHGGLDVVSAGVPDVPTLFPRGLRIANRRVYARLHSANAANWYAGGKRRYNYDFLDEELHHWAGDLRAPADVGRADECLVFFNNCVTTQAVANARRLAAMLMERDHSRDRAARRVEGAKPLRRLKG